MLILAKVEVTQVSKHLHNKQFISFQDLFVHFVYRISFFKQAQRFRFVFCPIFKCDKNQDFDVQLRLFGRLGYLVSLAKEFAGLGLITLLELFDSCLEHLVHFFDFIEGVLMGSTYGVVGTVDQQDHNQSDDDLRNEFGFQRGLFLNLSRHYLSLFLYFSLFFKKFVQNLLKTPEFVQFIVILRILDLCLGKSQNHDKIIKKISLINEELKIDKNLIKLSLFDIKLSEYQK